MVSAGECLIPSLRFNYFFICFGSPHKLIKLGGLVCYHSMVEGLGMSPAIII